MPNFQQIKCYEHVGSRDCGPFAIAYAVDILNKSNVYNLIYEQNKMTEHLITYFEKKNWQHFHFMKKEIQKKLHTKKDLHHGISPDIQLDYNKKTQKLTKRPCFQIVLKQKGLTLKRKT